jgi:hypothetical protein
MTTTIFLTTALFPDYKGEDGMDLFGAYPSRPKAAEALAAYIVEVYSDEDMNETEIRETLENGYPYDLEDVCFVIETIDFHN